MTTIDEAQRDALHAHAVQCGKEGRLEEAEKLLRLVLQLNPADALAEKHLGLILLSRGEYREGAAFYEARLRLPRKEGDPALSYHRWAGEPLDGKSVLIWPEQGFGDQIMLARFAPLLRERGCDVTLLCHPALEALFKRSLNVRVCGMSGEVEFPDPDVWLWANSLIPALGVTPSDLSGKPYLSAASRPTGARIGIAARGNPTHGNDAARSAPGEIARRLTAIPGAISLLPEDTGATSFEETAELVSGLDLVISVDTSIAHLAGALGKPVWILLPAFGTDWRWGRGTVTSHWYSTARLFRQPAPGDWLSVLEEVEHALAQT